MPVIYDLNSPPTPEREAALRKWIRKRLDQIGREAGLE